jgi:hypothetical protein
MSRLLLIYQRIKYSSELCKQLDSKIKKRKKISQNNKKNPFLENLPSTQSPNIALKFDKLAGSK